MQKIKQNLCKTNVKQIFINFFSKMGAFLCCLNRCFKGSIEDPENSGWAETYLPCFIVRIVELGGVTLISQAIR